MEQSIEQSPKLISGKLINPDHVGAIDVFIAEPEAVTIDLNANLVEVTCEHGAKILVSGDSIFLNNGSYTFKVNYTGALERAAMEQWLDKQKSKAAEMAKEKSKEFIKKLAYDLFGAVNETKTTK